MKNRKGLATGLALAVLAIASVRAVVWRATSNVSAVEDARPTSPITRAGPGTTTIPDVDRAPRDDDGAPAAGAEAHGETSLAPSAEVLRLDRAFWTEAQSDPERAHDTVAEREGVDVQTLMAAISEVSAYRVQLEIEARAALAGRSAIEVRPEGVRGTPLGNTTLTVRIFVPGCGGTHRADPEQLARAQAMFVQLVSLIPER